MEAVRKSYGNVHALQGVDLQVPAGTVLGLLGPNGAGKTTLVKILTTLLRPDAGRAWVAGFDVVHQATPLRAVIGLAGQSAAVDGNLTGRENLEMVGRLHHLGGRMARDRACELLERFGLLDAAERRTKTYSGGMRRRLDLAASLVARPQVLFLDEPTSGLDPHSRRDLWDVIKELVRDGATVLLTTQYLEEADQLATTIAVIDHGHLIAQGTPAELKRRTGGEVLAIRVDDLAAADRAAALVRPYGESGAQVARTDGHLSIPVSGGSALLAGVVRDLDAAGVSISDIALRQPTLDDVFFALTGHAAEAASAGDSAVAAGRSRRDA
ncbi:MAG: ATP-binding cassette domain-containing protein [Actinobacteria bacterium]|nr:ATP-binding cassette domain-containing protein [Actinomycetota bacterium]